MLVLFITASNDDGLEESMIFCAKSGLITVSIFLANSFQSDTTNFLFTEYEFFFNKNCNIQ